MIAIALDLAANGYYVHPLCWPDDDGHCACGRNHDDKEVGKAPLALRGDKDATRDPAIIRDWWERWPDANIGFNLEKSGILDIAPDSAEWAETFTAQGMPPTARYTSRSAWHALYRLPSGAPRLRICKSGQYDVMSKGNSVAPGSRHKSGHVYTLLADLPPVHELPEAPAWAVAMLHDAKHKHAAPSPIQQREVERWLGNISSLLAADGLPRRLSEKSQTRRILTAGLVWHDTSAQRYVVIRGLVMHGYSDAKITALIIHFADYDASGRKGSRWFYGDIARILGKVRAELSHILPSDGHEDRARQYALPAPLPQVERRTRGRPCTMTADDYLAWLHDQIDAGGVVMQSQAAIAAALGKGIATIRRWERTLKDRKLIERRTFAHRHDSYLAILGAIKNAETAHEQPESMADVVLSQMPVDRVLMPQTKNTAVLGETHPPDSAPDDWAGIDEEVEAWERSAEGRRWQQWDTIDHPRGRGVSRAERDELRRRGAALIAALNLPDEPPPPPSTQRNNPHRAEFAPGVRPVARAAPTGAGCSPQPAPAGAPSPSSSPTYDAVGLPDRLRQLTAAQRST